MIKRILSYLHKKHGKVISRQMDLQRILFAYLNPLSLSKLSTKLKPVYKIEFDSYSGIDLKVAINDPDDESYEPLINNPSFQYKLINPRGIAGNINAISFGPTTRNTDPEMGGSIVFTIFKRHPYRLEDIEELMGRRIRLTIFHIEGDGKPDILIDKVVVFRNSIKWGTGVDDIIIGSTLDFYGYMDHSKYIECKRETGAKNECEE